jgi:DNA mismatch repair protein MSH6
MSSHRSASSENDGDVEEDILDLDLEEAPKKTKSKGKGKAATTKSYGGKQAAGLGDACGFLTAAEQRAQGKKEEKKAAEEPYSFLQDVRDVSSSCIEYADTLHLSLC